MSVRITLLGAFDARVGATGSLTFPTVKAKALFAYLAMEQSRPQTREHLSTLFWGDIREDRSRANLRQALTRIRQSLPQALRDGLVARNGSVKLDADTFKTDTHEFETLMREATIDSLEHAAALYRSELLEGFPTGSEPFEEWLRLRRQSYRESAVECFDHLLEHYQEIGAATRGIEICVKLLALDPYRESAHRLLMNFYADQEHRGAALDQFAVCRKLLADEFDVEPEQETVDLYHSIKELSAKTRYTMNPELSRPAVTKSLRRRTSTAVTDLVGRSPWCGASWTKPSIAILPFDCLEAEGSHAYLCDGLVEDLITNLARFQDLHVIARNSSFVYRDRKPDLRRVGKELGVRYIVEGSLQIVGKGFRVTALLIEADTGFHVWAESYDRDAVQFTDLRDDLARQISSVLVGRIENHQLKKLSERKPESWEVYQCWLRGMDLLRKVSRTNVDEAREHFERALQIDPTYARAYAGLAMTQYKAWSCLNWTSWWKLQDEAVPFAKKAVELDDDDHHAHTILGVVSLFTKDHGVARFHLERAERINPNDAKTLANSSIAWSVLGEPVRGVKMAELAIRLDPFHPDWYLASLGIAYFVAKDYERAIAAMELASDGMCDARAYLAAAYALSGDTASAQRHVVEFIRTSCERLGGDPDTDLPAYVDAIVNKSPYRRAADLAHFVDGLRLAGLPASVNGHPE